MSSGKTMSFFEIKDDLYKVCLIGDGGVGKTAIVEQLLGKGFSSTYNLTIGTNICTCAVEIDERRIKYQIWDLAGQQRFEFVRASFYRGSHAIIMVFDVTNPNSFINLREWKFEVLQNLRKNPPNIPVLLLGNKCDLQEKQVIDSLTIENFREELKFDFQSGEPGFLYTSALSGMNVLEAFEILGHQLLKNKKATPYLNRAPDIVPGSLETVE